MAVIYRPGDTCYVEWYPRDATGAAVFPNSPAATLYRNNVLDGTVTIAIGTPLVGIVTGNFAIPNTYVVGDVLHVVATGTPQANVGVKQGVERFRLDIPTNVLWTSITNSYGTPVVLPTTLPAAYATAANQTTIISNQTAQGGTPSQILVNTNTIITNQTSNSATLLTAVQQLGGTPAQNQQYLKGLYGTPVIFPAGVPSGYATSATQTTILAQIAAAGGTPSQNAGAIATGFNNVQLTFAVQGGTPAQNKVLIQGLSSGGGLATAAQVAGLGGTPSDTYLRLNSLLEIVSPGLWRYTTASLVNAPSGGGGGSTFTEAEKLLLFQGALITGGDIITLGDGRRYGVTPGGTPVYYDVTNNGNTKTVTYS